MDKKWKELYDNPPSNWREVWNNRKKLICFGTEQQAQKYIKKHQSQYTEKLLMDIHPKDGYVVYIES